MKKGGRKGGYHSGSFTQELMPFSGRLNKGYGDIPGPTEVRPVMGGGVREINVASSKSVQECASRGRNRGSSLRIIIS